MMMDMVERVARALADNGRLGVSLAFTEDAPSDTKTIRQCRAADTEMALSVARAAIEAMREPTEAMKLAGGMIPEAFKGTSAARGNADRVYRSMIDAALTPVHAPIG